MGRNIAYRLKDRQIVEPTKRSDEIQTILKLDEIGQTRPGTACLCGDAYFVPFIARNSFLRLHLVGFPSFMSTTH